MRAIFKPRGKILEVRIYLYIARYIGFVGCVITFFLLGTIWLTQSIKFVELVLGQPEHHTLWLILKVTVLLIPDLFVLICPFSFFLAVVFAYNRLLYDREITIMRSIGLSNLQLAYPVFGIGVLLAILILFLNIWILPSWTTHLKDMENSMRHGASLAFVKVNEFNTFPGLILFMKEKDAGDSFRGILAYIQESNGHSYTLIAQKGEIVRGQDNKLTLVLEHGQKQDRHPTNQTPQTLSFEKTYVPLVKNTEEVKGRPRKSAEYSLRELFFEEHSQIPLLDQKRLIIEGFNRFLTPFAPLSYMVLGVCVILISVYRRRKLLGPIVLAGISILSLHAVYMLLIHLAVKTFWGLAGAYILIFGGISLGVVLLWLKKMPLVFQWPFKRIPS